MDPMDLSLLANPEDDAAPSADDETSPLLDALDQMRALCDQIEADQVKQRTAKPAEPDEDDQPAPAEGE